MTAKSAGLYLISDKEGEALGMGRLVTPPGAPEIRLEVMDNKIDEIEEYEELVLTGMGGSEPGMICRLLRCRGETAVLKKTGELPQDARRNLRVPLKYATFLYPLDSSWHGRAEARLLDLSCGGVAFFSRKSLEIGQRAEIVIPALEAPMVLQMIILRKKEPEEGAEESFHAAKFIDLCEDEEVLVRESVFSIQLENHARRAGTGNG